jgi:hypothetical protein
LHQFSLKAIRKSVLKISVPELANRTRLPQYLAVQCALKQRHEPHSLPPETKRYLRE